MKFTFWLTNAFVHFKDRPFKKKKNKQKTLPVLPGYWDPPRISFPSTASGTYSPIIGVGGDELVVSIPHQEGAGFPFDLTPELHAPTFSCSKLAQRFLVEVRSFCNKTETFQYCAFTWGSVDYRACTFCHIKLDFHIMMMMIIPRTCLDTAWTACNK